MKYILLLLLFIPAVAMSQTADSIIFKNGNYIVGEIKGMDRGTLTVETDYSDSDFKIEWSGIAQIHAKTLLLVFTTDRRRLYGTLTTTGEGVIVVKTDDGNEVNLDLNSIVGLKPIDKGFLDRLYAGIDLGYSLTKARNQRQYTMRSRAGYLAEKWTLDMAYNSLISRQDDVEDIERTDGFISFRYMLPSEWYVIAQLDFLSNTEQLLDLRSNVKLGLGKYIIRTNQYYWGAQGGISFNNENYFAEADDRQSSEAWFGTELNLYDIGDFSLLTKALAYPSITEDGRWRLDFNIDLKYDLPLDFYIKSGLTLNYDNQPVEGSSNSDYVWQTTFGWEW